MIKRFIKYVYNAIEDPERETSERIFVIFSIISEIAVIIALIGDIVFGESIYEILTLVAIIVVVPLTTLICLYLNKIKVAIFILVTGLIFAILPALFFFGGGIEGGGVIWMVFGFIYIGLVISGKWRLIMLGLQFLVSCICFVVGYFNPELVYKHTREMFYIDTFISIILVGVVCFYMTWSQNEILHAENNRAKEAAKQAEDLTIAQNRFFSSMSHEIRTPINSILGLNELILRDQDISDEIVRDATGIQGAGKLLLALINDILDFSKMEAGSMDIVPVDYRVGDMLSEIVNMIWLKTQEKGLGFEVTIDPNVPSVLYGDEVRIKQIIINLLNNAVKYTKEGTVELHIESKNTDEKTTLLTITISDTGMGIKRESLPFLFDAFKRVDEEKNRYIEGTGLGLSIVKQLTELMGGKISVNSVYGEGSIFTVTLDQGISDPTKIGNLNIHSYQDMKRSHYESSFKAPDARVLIVDDNDMNLEVEKKLLQGTMLTVDTASDGKSALELTLASHYDVILMDHLMPGMDGIECLSNIRSQVGGLNRTTPVIVLTANAGSENRELYNNSGFDGYLVKPVSGEALEEILIKHISRDKLIVSGKISRMRKDINTTDGYARKASVIITSTSMCDLPDAVIRKLNIPILPFLIRTKDGVFKDGIQIDAGELIRFINSGGEAVSMPPDVDTYTDFFAKNLKKAHHLIHISMTTSMSEDYKVASEAAKSFDNVTVINSKNLSSSMGILVLIANKLAQQNVPVDNIIRELEIVKERLRSSFIIDTTDYMVKKALIKPYVHKIARIMNLHPGLQIKNDRSGVGRVWMGSSKRAYRNYIHSAFPVDIIPDSDIVFITYVDIPMETLLWIKDEISKTAFFEHVVFQQASAAISSNCGPGAFGILYFVKSNKSYNIGSYIDEEYYDKEPEPAEERVEETAAEEPEQKELRFGFIDEELAIKNSGSYEAFDAVLKIFYDSIDAKAKELDGFYDASDWENYTIKIHALKSSSKLIGAMDFAEKAQLLENAGKSGDIDYITNNHAPLMKEYRDYKERLSEYYGKETADTADERPVADKYLMESVYEGLIDAAKEMDCDMLSEIIDELAPYSIPDTEKDKYASVLDCIKKYDYDGILEILESK